MDSAALLHTSEWERFLGPSALFSAASNRTGQPEVKRPVHPCELVWEVHAAAEEDQKGRASTVRSREAKGGERSAARPRGDEERVRHAGLEGGGGP